MRVQCSSGLPVHSTSSAGAVAMLLDPKAISMMPPELEHNNHMNNSATVVAIRDLMQRTSPENEEQTVEEAVFAPKGSLV